MPREIARKPRFIYPTIATSLSIAKLSALAELLFWRLLPQADDQGRLPGYPKQLKAIACPMRDDLTEQNIPKLLKELKDADLIIQYSASSESLIQIKGWWSYQSGMRRIYPSKYPPPEGWEDKVKGIQGFYLSGGQTPTNAPNVHLKSEVVNISSSKYISISEVTPPTNAPTEREFLKLLSTLNNWKADESEDLVWLGGFISQFPDFTPAELEACSDYHSGRAPPKQMHKGIWKNRFRNWMIKKREFAEKQRPSKLPTTNELEEGWKQ